MLKSLGFRITLKTEVQILQRDELKSTHGGKSGKICKLLGKSFTAICNHFSELVKNVSVSDVGKNVVEIRI